MIINVETNLIGATALVIAVAAAISAGLCVLLRPIFIRYALARPNARSSHRVATPQGGGIAVIGATIGALFFATFIFPGMLVYSAALIALLAATAGLAIVGMADDIHPLGVAPRLLLQAFAVAVVIMTLPEELRVVHALPWWLERALLVLGGMWFVNAVNFMDGIDWMTVAEVIPVTAALAIFGLIGALPRDAALVSIALCGAVAGFAPYNRPIARLFLGDVGSLPIGLLLGWPLTELAGRGHLTAALLLPLYYLADASITLIRRLAKGETIAQAHRSHFYQRAMDNGMLVHQIVGAVFVVNLILAALAAATILNPSPAFRAVMLVCGSAIVGVLLWMFARKRRLAGAG
ncbi:MAG: glycosyl transferase [Pseudolabrys sp.]